VKVSVVIPVYNAEAYVEQAVLSALEQPQTAEVVLIEDGSSDESLPRCLDLARAHPRVRLLRHADGGNHGASASRNLGITSCVGDFIAFLDADDFMLDDRFAPAQARFAENPSIDGVYDAVDTCFEGETARRWWTEHRGTAMLTTLNAVIAPEQLFADLLSWRHGWFCTDGIVVRRQLFERTGLFDTGLQLAEDSLLWRKMALVGRLVGGSLDRPVATRRVHGGNTIISRLEDDAPLNREMLRRLLRWCRGRELRDSDRHALIAALVNQIEPSGSSYRLGIVPRAMRAIQLLALVASDPQVMRNATWRRAASDAIGLTSLRRRLSGRRRSSPDGSS
jgi:glycosyltransferase involved in cell wall biosynthesis